MTQLLATICQKNVGSFDEILDFFSYDLKR